ncbi:hypothetical protein IMSAG049_00211 [Clostridiales bacterium]|nr:hypothetical protein IMSAG049_00211 [Clostridiales bacterium]
MEKQKGVFLKADFFLNALILICTSILIRETYDGMSFGGFMALFMLLILIPYFFVSILILIMLNSKNIRLWQIACILQIICPAPWILLVYSFEHSASWFEIIMIIQMIVGIAGLLLMSKKL